jgi:hypothetical protein
MSRADQRSRPRVKLPPTLAIGFTGHRHLPDEDQSRTAIRKVLEEWKARIPGVAYGVSSIAAGGDLLFAETCLDLKLPIRIFLPMSKERFRDEFDDRTSERAERVLAGALSVEVVGVGAEPQERYYECGIETVHQSQLLIALWDGGPGHGMGGTSDMVYFAKEQGRLVVWIHSVTGQVRHLNECADFLRDPELDFLNSLEEASAELPVGTAYDLAHAWLVKVDENASRVAPQFRRLAAMPIFCTAAAAILSGRSSFTGTSVVWLWMGTTLGIMAAALPFLMRLNHRQIVWTRERTAAEVCRSCLALWRTPALYDVIGPETAPELAGMLTSLNFLKLSDRASGQITHEEFKRIYREGRLQHQIAYFERHAGRSATQVRNYQIVIWASVCLAAALNLLLIMNAHGLNGWVSQRWKPVLALVATTGFQIATVAGALLFVYDYQRRRERYRDLHRMLTQWDKQLELSQTWPIVLRITSLVEKALLAELIEWRSLIRHRKVPEK